MNLLSRLCITPAVHVRLSVVGHSEFDRVIELPAGSSADWLVDAYLLSLGKHRENAHSDFDGRIAMHPSYWRSECQTLRLPEIPHEIDVLVMDGRMPTAGDPCVALIEAEPDDPASTGGRWQSDAPPFRIRHINNELAQQFGVVVPSFDDSDLASGHGIRSSSRLDALLRALTPARRIALLGHLDDSGIFAERPLELSTVESAISSLASLFDYIGVDGLVQDPDTGWIADRDAAEIVRRLDWISPGIDVISAPDETVLSLARRSKLIRRLNGRILVTNRGRALIEPGAQTLSVLADAISQRDNRSGAWSHEPDPHGRTLALLAIADGSAETFVELPALIGLGRKAVDEYRRSPHRYDGYGLYGLPLDDSMTAADTGVPVKVRQIVDRLASLSEPGRFGVISPAMRAVARAALL